jgi:hypothetical protein
MAYTKKIYFKALEDYFKNNEIVISKTAIQGEGELQDDITSKDIINFVTHEIELLSRKNSKSGATKTQKENEIVANMLVEELAKIGKPITITDLINTSETVKNYILENGNNLTNQKISAIFKQLKESNKIVKVTDKKKSYFSIVE